MLLNEKEVRVLGTLIEKEITTPEYYPLTLNSLTVACNQKNNRNPITAYNEQGVDEALDSLRAKNLAYVFHGSTSRVPKYKHVAAEILHLTRPEIAVLCVLMLSGAQTIGEIRGRASRMHPFTNLDEVEDTLNGLATKDPDPLVVRFPRQSGQKEVRFAHLLSGTPPVESLAAEAVLPKQSRRAEESGKLEKLEQQVQALAIEVENLRARFEEFSKQFE